MIAEGLEGERERVKKRLKKEGISLKPKRILHPLSMKKGFGNSSLEGPLSIYKRMYRVTIS
jgi:hypothetical protein